MRILRMDMNQSNSQNYWFVLREDQSNVIFTSNNFTIQNQEGLEARYVVDTGDNKQYDEFESNISVPPHTHTSEISTQEPAVKQTKENNFWDRNKIKLLLTLCLENKTKYLNEKKLAELWIDIASLLGTTPEECSKKYKNLRRTYIRLLKKKEAGIDIKWVHYRSCEEVFKDCKVIQHTVLEQWVDAKVRLMLHLYLENLNKFNNPECLKKEVWKDIASQLNTTEYNCYHKFMNLKRTYINLLKKSGDTRKIMKWPYQQYFDRIYYDYHPSPSPWNRIAIKGLLDAYALRASKFQNPRFMKKELWKEISMEVGQSPTNCDRKFRNLKQTYIKLKMRAQSGGIVTKWRYYKDFEKIFNNDTYHIEEGGTRSHDYIAQMLTFYIENKDKFKDPLTKKKSLWKVIGRKLSLSPEECNKKFRNMKQTYIRLLDKKRETGECNRWPYFTFFEKIFDESELSEDVSCEDIRLSEIRRAVQEVNERRDNDEKFNKLMTAVEESNKIQKERNRILQTFLDRLVTR